MLQEKDLHKESPEDKDSIIAEQNRKIQTLYQQVDMLNGKLSELYASEGWKLLSIYYRIRERLLPKGSRFHRVVKRTINLLRGKKSDDFPIEDHSGPGAGLTSWTIPTIFDSFSFPYFSHPKVSIIIPAYNGWGINYQCLRSISEHTDGVSYEVIFADDGSTDETRYADRYAGNLVHIRNEKNLGFLKNCNHAASFAKGEYLHFLNNDTKVTPGWLSSLVNLLERDPSIGMTGSKLVYPNGRLQEAGGIIWQDASGWNYGHKQDPARPEFNYVKEVDYISGASILVRRSLWEELGGFDILYDPAYCEDADLAFSIRRKGFKVVYQPQSRVVHFEGFSHGTDMTKSPGSIKSYQQINLAKFAEKWKTVLQEQFPNGVNAYWTRDRTHRKPTILVIDHYVPEFDKDAGSRTTFQYLDLFVEMGFNVKFMGDNFYRKEPYTGILQQKGIEVLYGDEYAKTRFKWLKDNERYIDHILLNRPHVSIKYIDFIKENMHGKIYYYTHDLHFFREMMEYELTKDPKTLASSDRWKQMEYTLFAKSDTVLTPSIKEKEIISADFPDKTVKVMPAFFYPSIGEPVKNFDDRKDILFVGGFNHTPNIDALQWFAEAVMPAIREKNTGLRLLVVGSNPPGQIAKLACSDIIIMGFVSDEELDQLYGRVRLCVIPLRFGSGLKGKTVEALSRALPIVSTSFGIEGLEHIEGIATPKDEPGAFAEAVTTLYTDIPGLEKISQAAASYSLAHFTKDAAKTFFSTLFNV